MINLFIWEKYYRDATINSWKKAFALKFSELNIIHIKNPLNYDLSFFTQNLSSTGLFSEKTLVIIDDFESFFAVKDLESDKNKDNLQKITDFFIHTFSLVWENTILVLNCNNFDKRLSIYKHISKIWEIKDYTIKDLKDLKTKLLEKYKKVLDENVIDYLIELKWQNFASIMSEIEKNLLNKTTLKKSDFLNVSKDIEENIFEIINLILNDDFKIAISIIRKNFIVLDNEFFFLNWLLSNLRTYFFIFSLQEKNETNSQIKDKLELWNRAFLINQKFKIKKDKFFQIYAKLIKIDENIKTWKSIWSSREDILFEIEKSFF